jgi:hypothetical protein
MLPFEGSITAERVKVTRKNGNYYGDQSSVWSFRAGINHAHHWFCKHADAGETGAGPDSKLCGDRMPE